MQFDATGKVTLDHIYAQPDPRPYFATLCELDYMIPQLAKPHFQQEIESFRAARGVDVPRVLDIGCSYGINAALLRCDVTMAELYERYAAAHGRTRDELLTADRALLHVRGNGLNGNGSGSGNGATDGNGGSGARGSGVCATFTGLDIAEPALNYARDAGFLDDIVHADLEATDPTAAQLAQLGRADLIVSTGCLGYVGANTLSRVVGACADREPWMAHFMLRMFSFDPIADCLADFGYHTVRQPGVFKQRRFASPEEQSQVLETLSAAGVDPGGLEAEGWFYAELFLSRPRVRKASTTIDLVSDTSELSVK